MAVLRSRALRGDRDEVTDDSEDLDDILNRIARYLALVRPMAARVEKAEARVAALEALIVEVLDRHCCVPQDWGERAEKLLDRWKPDVSADALDATEQPST